MKGCVRLIRVGVLDSLHGTATCITKTLNFLKKNLICYPNFLSHELLNSEHNISAFSSC